MSGLSTTSVDKLGIYLGCVVVCCFFGVCVCNLQFLGSCYADAIAEVFMKKGVVNASDVGKAAYCPHSLSLSKLGFKGSDESVELRRVGTESHDELTSTVLREGGAGAGRECQSQDSRCYVASYAFGDDHYVTQSLRDWRDKRLKNLFFGRVFIAFYYTASPCWVSLCRSSLKLTRLSRVVVMALYRRTLHKEG